MSGWFASLASVGMAVGPPLAYSDQYISILRKHDSSGFSIDICGLLIVANVTRVFYYFGYKFQTALLVQSILMILAQFALLYVCLLYRDPKGNSRNVNVVESRSAQELEVEGLTTSTVARSTRPGQLWQWKSFGSYLEFVALLVVFHSSTFLVLHSFDWYVTGLGFVALGLEATLPIPQLLVNFGAKSTAGFRHTVLAGWFFGDLVKTLYFFFTANNSTAFKACAIFQLSVDVLLVFQTYLYRKQTAIDERERRERGLEGEEGVAGPEEVLRVAKRERRRRGERGEDGESGSEEESEEERESEGESEGSESGYNDVGMTGRMKTKSRGGAYDV